ncbi:hypothetical protein T492DRAFT_49484 [Pavlovales sp. CCMP2436]|nr:hypothetical protein T492DRAFT_49484 [Pavlovales sp. CCMP2436]
MPVRRRAASRGRLTVLFLTLYLHFRCAARGQASLFFFYREREEKEIPLRGLESTFIKKNYRNFFGAARCRAVARGHLRRLGILQKWS